MVCLHGHRRWIDQGYSPHFPSIRKEKTWVIGELRRGLVSVALIHEREFVLSFDWCGEG